MVPIAFFVKALVSRQGMPCELLDMQLKIFRNISRNNMLGVELFHGSAEQERILEAELPSSNKGVSQIWRAS